jgi:peptide chain release factor 3
MALEQERGISVTSSVMQFPYAGRIVNLLDTPGHEDFSEDTYRTLTAVDSALMVIDCAKGVEERTIKLMEVCRLRDTPIMTFINKLDREARADRAARRDRVGARHPLRAGHLADRHGRASRAWYHLVDRRRIHVYEQAGRKNFTRQTRRILGSTSPEAGTCSATADELMDETRTGAGASQPFDRDAYLAGRRRRCSSARRSTTSACNCCSMPSSSGRRRRGARDRPRATSKRPSQPFSGFVFKIQANMDPRHRDRIAFMRVCSGRYEQGMKAFHVRIGKEVRVATP